VKDNAMKNRICMKYRFTRKNGDTLSIQQVPNIAKGCFQIGACTVASVHGKRAGTMGGRRRRHNHGQEERRTTSLQLSNQTSHLLNKTIITRIITRLMKRNKFLKYKSDLTPHVVISI